MVKLLFSYDMVQGREEDCQRYVMQTLVPGLAKLGLQISDAWYTLWGEDTPQILGGGLMENERDASKLIHSSDWETLVEGMEPFVENFHVRVVEASGRIQF